MIGIGARIMGRNALVRLGIELDGLLRRNEADQLGFYALEAGFRTAEAFRARGLIEGAALFLQGEMRVTGALALQQGGASG